jgi:hypothetical protein
MSLPEDLPMQPDLQSVLGVDLLHSASLNQNRVGQTKFICFSGRIYILHTCTIVGKMSLQLIERTRPSTDYCVIESTTDLGFQSG